jgi:2-phosphosulfolactate phosphatase
VSETVAIDFSPERATTHGEGAAIIAVDVIRATTTAVTGVVLGRECYPVPSLEVAVPLAARLHRPLLVGELGGNRPYGFDLTNSPYELAHRTDVERPMILLSTSGTRLIAAPPRAEQVYCAWIARELVAAGYHVHDERTRKIIARWSEEPVESLLVSPSVTYLRETGQEDDLDFVMTHVDDVDGAFVMRGNRLVSAIEGSDGSSAGLRHALPARR